MTWFKGQSLRSRLAAWVVGSAAVLGASPAHAIDLFNNGPPAYPSTSGVSTMGCGTYGGTEYLCAYPFVPSVSGAVTNLVVWAQGVGGMSYAGVLELRTNNAGLPSGTVLATGSFTAQNPVSTTTNVTMTPQSAVTGGTTYWVVMRGAGYPQWMFQSDAASNPKQSTNGGSTWSAAPFPKTPSLQVIGTQNPLPPTVAAFSKSANEDVTVTFATADFTAAYADANGDAMTNVQFTSLPANGTLRLSGTAVAVNQVIAAGSLGNLTFVPTANWNGTTTFTWKAQDSSTAWSTSAATITITINSVNDAPTFTLPSTTVTVNEDCGAQTVAGFATGITPGGGESQTLTFSMVNDNPGLFSVLPAINSGTGALSFTPTANASGVAVLTITLADNGGTANGGVDRFTFPTNVRVVVNAVNDPPSFTVGSNLSVTEDCGPQTVANQVTGLSVGPADESAQTLMLTVTNDNGALFSAQPSISAGTLTYTPAANTSGMATVTVRAQDNGGTLYGGVDSTTKTFTITVSAVNDPPSFTKGPDQTVLEDSGAKTVTGWATNISPGPADEVNQVVNFVIVSVSNAALFSAAPSITPSGTLSYTPAANASGAATVTISLRDNGGGPTDTSATQTFTINVTAVNDPPTFTLGASLSVAEDCGAQTVANQVTALSPGPADESAQTLTLTTTNDNNALFSTQPSISAGTLTYTPAANANGVATVTVLARDSGGTANGGVDNTSKTFTITVSAVNDPPSFTKGLDPTVLEDSGPQTLVGWATNVSAGAANESAQVLDFMVTAATPALFTAQPAMDASGTLRFTPAPDAWGSTSVTVRLHDDGGGTTNTSADQTFTITLSSVNDAPSFAVGADITLPEDSPAQSVTGFVSAVSPGPANESTQTVSFTAVAAAPGLFSAQPTLVGNTLSFTPAPNASGTCVVTVTGKDTGGTANNGVDTATRTFTITLSPANDAPVVDDTLRPVFPDINEDDINNSGARVLDVLASVAPAFLVTDVDVGALQGVAVTAADTANGQWQFSLDGAGWTPVGGVSDALALLLDDANATRLRFVPAADFNGTATLGFRAWDRTSGASGATANTTSNGGSTAFSVRSAVATITVLPVNDLPVLANLETATLTTAEKAAPVAVTASLTVTDRDNPTLQGAVARISANYVQGEDVLALAAPVGALTASWDAAAGTLSLQGADTLARYQDALRAVTYVNTSANPSPLSRTLTLTVSDGPGTSLPVSRTISVTPVNDAPVLGGMEGVPLVFTEDDPPTALSATLDALDADQTAFPTGVVRISSGYRSGEDVLASVDSATVQGQWDPLSGTLYLSCTGSLADLEAALRTVTYSNTSQAPSTVVRTVSILVTDGALHSNTVTRDITVVPVNDAPVLGTLADTSVAEGATLAFTITGTDPDSTTLTFSATGLPAGATLNSSTGAFAWTPGYDQADTPVQVIFTVSDGSLQDSRTLTITVTNSNRAPVLNPVANQTVAVGRLLSFTVSASDPDGDSLTFAASNLPSGATFLPDTATFSWTPAAGQEGNYPGVHFTVSDGALSASMDVLVSVTAASHAPVFDALTDMTVAEGSLLAFTVHATDPDGNAPISYSANGLPTGAAFDAAGAFRWTPGYSAEGYYGGITFVAAKGALTSSVSISITVTNTNRMPMAQDQAVDVLPGTETEVTLTGVDPDGDSLVFAVKADPTHGTLSGTAPSLKYTPAAGFLGQDSFTFTVSDGLLVSLEATVTLDVADPDGGVADDAGTPAADAGTVLPGDAGTPVQDGGFVMDASSVEELDGGATGEDGGSVAADGGTAEADGGVTETDAGSVADDGGATVVDAAVVSADAGSGADAARADGGTSSGSDAGTVTDVDAGDSGGGAQSDSSSCGCSQAQDSASAGWLLLGVLGLFLARSRRKS